MPTKRRGTLMTIISQPPSARAPMGPSTAHTPGLAHTQYTYFRREHELVLTLHGVESRHVNAVSREEAEFALIDESPLLMLCARFGEAIPWISSPFCWHHVPSEDRVLPPAAGSDDERRLQLQIVLIDGNDGMVKATRCVTFTLDFTRLLNEAIREQARLPYDPREQERRSKELRRRCPTPHAMVAYAAARTLGLP